MFEFERSQLVKLWKVPNACNHAVLSSHENAAPWAFDWFRAVSCVTAVVLCWITGALAFRLNWNGMCWNLFFFDKVKSFWSRVCFSQNIISCMTSWDEVLFRWCCCQTGAGREACQSKDLPTLFTSPVNSRVFDPSAFFLEKTKTVTTEDQTVSVRRASLVAQTVSRFDRACFLTKCGLI